MKLTSLFWNLLLKNSQKISRMKSIVFMFIFGLLFMVNCEEKKPKSWKEKNIMDMTDADMERLLDQWEEGDDPLEEDELPEHLRPPPKIDLSKIDPSDPDNLLRMTKMGKNVMMFVDVREDLSEEEGENVLKLWQGSLQNNHLIAERYPIEPRRAVFMFREGSQAVDAKNFFVEQPELERVTLEGQTYHGKNSKEKNEGSTNKQKARTDEL